MNSKKQQSINNNFQIQISTQRIFPEDFPTIKEQWLILEQHSTPSYFLTWHWIGNWLEQLTTNETLHLVKATTEKTVVGLGIFIEKRVTLHKFFPRTRWYLHRTGDEQLDQIWIEDNDFLIHSADTSQIRNTMWNYIFNAMVYVDEFVINVAKLTSFEEIPSSTTYQQRIENQELGYAIDCNQYSNFNEYLQSLSKNTRQQFTRSLNTIKKLGNFQFNIIQDTKEQLKVIQKTQQWHINKWSETPTPSGFTNPTFSNFHKALILSKSQHTDTLVFSITINNETLGCSYCFMQNSKVYFYLSCLKPITHNKIKLGITLHLLAIQWLFNNSENKGQYDFLAGEARYKKSLAPIVENYGQIVFQKNALLFKLERFLKSIKQWLFKH